MELDKKKATAQLGITEEDYEELLVDAVEYIENAFGQLEGAFRYKNFSGMSDIAHKIKGTSGSLRIVKVYETASEIEELSQKTTDLNVLKERMIRLKKDFTLLKDSVKKLV